MALKVGVIISFTIPFLACISCSNLPQSREPQSLGRAFDKGGTEIGELIDGLVRKAELQSPNRSLRELVSEMGFSPEQIPKSVLQRIRETDAIDNPIHYFYHDNILLSRPDIPDFKSVFLRTDIISAIPRITPPPSPAVRFLRQFVGTRLDLDNQDHLLTLWEVFSASIERGRPSRLSVYTSDFQKMAKYMGYNESQRGDLVAACLQNDTISQGALIRNIAAKNRVPTLLSSYFKPQGFGYDLLLETIGKLHELPDSALVKSLWEHAHDIAKADKGIAVKDLKTK